MPETITTLSGFEAKPGSNAQGSYTLSIFTDVEGKKFKTFQADVADKAKSLIGQLVVVSFSVKQQNRNGRVFTDNFLDSLKLASEVSTGADAGGGDVSAVSPTAQKILAFRAAIDLLGAMPEKFGEDPDFVAITRVADAIFDWASRSVEDEDIEPEPEPDDQLITN